MRKTIMKGVLAFTIAMWFVTLFAVAGENWIPFIGNLICSLVITLFAIANDGFSYYVRDYYS